MKALEGLKIMSGIDKGLCTGPVTVDSMGIVEEYTPQPCLYYVC